MKHVREKLYEKFEESSDPVEDMGIGVPEIRELRKSNKEYEKFLNFDGGDLDFNEVVDITNHLKTVIPYYVIFYFNEKYKLNLKVVSNTYGNFKYPKIYGGSLFAEGKIAGQNLDFHLSNSGISVSITFLQSGQSTTQCRSIHRLEAAFLKMCKKLGISLK